MARVSIREFLRAAFTWRMLALFAGLVVVAYVCIRLGSWQLDRASERAEQHAEAEAQAEANADPKPLGEVLQPGESFTGLVENQRVTVTGTYDEEQQVVVPNRYYEGEPGYGVVTPLRVDNAVLPVLRGWVKDKDDADAPPEGDVTITGMLRPSEGAERTDVEEGEISRISTAELVNQWGGPIWTGYALLEKSDPAQTAVDDGGLQILPLPLPEDAGLNWQNLAYAIEWWVFGGFFTLLWLRAVRDHARRTREVEEK